MTRARRSLSAAVVAVMGAVLALTAVTAAHAAPPYETEATLTDVSFVSQTVESGKRTELTGSWSLPNNPSTPAGFVVDLPAELSGLTDSFDLRDPSGLRMKRGVRGSPA